MINRAQVAKPRTYYETGTEDNPLAKTMSPEAFAQYLIHKMCAMLEEPESICTPDCVDYWL